MNTSKWLKYNKQANPCEFVFKKKKKKSSNLIIYIFFLIYTGKIMKIQYFLFVNFFICLNTHRANVFLFHVVGVCTYIYIKKKSVFPANVLPPFVVDCRTCTLLKENEFVVQEYSGTSVLCSRRSCVVNPRTSRMQYSQSIRE